MNFEAKYLIRWGIPGWVFLASIISYFIIIKPKLFIELLTGSNTALVGITAIFTAVGIILGHLMHQLSMIFGFILWNFPWSKYFDYEFNLDKVMMGKEGEKIQKIYSHRLGQVHALRALLVSVILSSITISILVMYYEYSNGSLYLLLGNLAMIIIIFINYLYFKSNLTYYVNQIKSLNHL